MVFIFQPLLKSPTVNFTTSSKSLHCFQVHLALNIVSQCFLTGRLRNYSDYKMIFLVTNSYWSPSKKHNLGSSSWLLIKLRFFQHFHLHTQVLIPGINLLKHSVTAQNNEHWSHFLSCVFYFTIYSSLCNFSLFFFFQTWPKTGLIHT